jgi:hypothetical protein
MKKLKIIILCCLGFIIGCTKKPLNDIFLTSESSISDGEEVMFKLASDSVYIIKIVDKSSGQVLSKEKIKGIIGANKIKIYTKSLPAKYLYLVLEDGNKKEMNKTTIIAK